MSITTTCTAKIPVTPTIPDVRGLNFLWLELTNQCNLECVHCYSDSSPSTKHRDRLTDDDYRRLLTEAADLGCRRVQFIGGEPTLNKSLPDFLRLAKQLGFEILEVYSNLVHVSDHLLTTAATCGARFATSIYSHDSESHAKVTLSSRSHTQTVANIKRLASMGIPVRGSIIVVDQPDHEISATKTFLQQLGVTETSTDRARPFGRGEQFSNGGSMTGLCGNCWRRSLSIASDGSASMCIMSRQWPVGNVCTESLTAIINGSRLRSQRSELYLSRAENYPAGSSTQDCNPTTCSPDLPCSPHTCSPNTVCAPESCGPYL